MALLKRSDLIEMIDGLTHAYISVNVKRGNLIEDKKGYIDDKNPINKLFIDKRISKAINKTYESEAVNPPSNTEQRPPRQQNENDLSHLKALKDKIWIKKTNEEYELRKIQKEKLQGEVIPIDLIKAIIIQVSEAVKLAWTDASEDLLLKISAKYQLDRSQHGELKKIQIGIVNSAIDNAVEVAKKSLKKIQAEYSVKKERGQHE